MRDTVILLPGTSRITKRLYTGPQRRPSETARLVANNGAILVDIKIVQADETESSALDAGFEVLPGDHTVTITWVQDALGLGRARRAGTVALSMRAEAGQTYTFFARYSYTGPPRVKICCRPRRGTESVVQSQDKGHHAVVMR